MTGDAPRPLTEEEIAALRVKDEWHTPLIARFLATLDARPSGDEALRAVVEAWDNRDPDDQNLQDAIEKARAAIDNLSPDTKETP